MIAPIRTAKEIKKILSNYSADDPEWFLYNSELRFSKAYREDTDSLDTKIWQFIRNENERVLNQEEEELESKWEVLPKQILPGLDELTSTILYNRGVTENIEDFISCPIEKIRPENIGHIDFASKLILRAIDRNIPITIYGDYDADGITGTALGMKALERLGARVDYYINSRSSGYAINEAGMREIASRGTPRLVITVDNGIASHEAIEFAREAQMAVIVTDHHEFNKAPNANAIIHSEKFDTPFAGVGVMFKLIHYLYSQLGRDDAFDFLGLVAIGTIADLVPLTGENRVLTKHGLDKLNKDPSPAVMALKEVLKIDRIKSTTIGFNIAPLINASSRINGTADQALSLLLEADYKKAKVIARSLVKINENRKKLVDKEVEKAEKLIDTYGNVIVLKSNFHPGVMGIVAGRIKEKYNRPVVVLSEKDGYLKGSCRSVEGFNIKEALDKCDFLEGYGGHAMAAGLSLKSENFNRLCEELTSQTKTLDIKPPVIQVDGILEDVNIATIERIEELEPYGVGFPAPLFIYECSPQEVKSVKNRHLKIIGDLDCIVWNAYEKFIEENPSNISLLGVPEINSYDNTIQFVAQDFRKS